MESCFTSENFKKAKEVGVDLQFSGIESHNLIGQTHQWYYETNRYSTISSGIGIAPSLPLCKHENTQ